MWSLLVPTCVMGVGFVGGGLVWFVLFAGLLGFG